MGKHENIEHLLGESVKENFASCYKVGEMIARDEGVAMQYVYLTGGFLYVLNPRMCARIPHPMRLLGSQEKVYAFWYDYVEAGFKQNARLSLASGHELIDEPGIVKNARQYLDKACDAKPGDPVQRLGIGPVMSLMAVIKRSIVKPWDSLEIKRSIVKPWDSLEIKCGTDYGPNYITWEVEDYPGKRHAERLGRAEAILMPRRRD